jgi:hypothetical protein
MRQDESIALIYALARKSLANGHGQEQALKEIVGIVERDFFSGRKSDGR